MAETIQFKLKGVPAKAVDVCTIAYVSNHILCTSVYPQKRAWLFSSQIPRHVKFCGQPVLLRLLLQANFNSLLRFGGKQNDSDLPAPGT